MKKTYECEAYRTGITPRQFFTYCKKQLEKKGGNIEDWVDFKEWMEPTTPCDNVADGEVCKLKPYEWHLYLKNSYNFIMEFNFWDDKKGSGYLYMVEYER